ncbi:MAG TPA: lipoyl(octanoyl) transferase LipB [Gemmatimonadales bacterium]|nr:lipoyl(octanoyl) transferase LipB [Gemmatimonadales bacterium]
MSRKPLAIVPVGRIGYTTGHALQRAVSQARIDGTIDRDVLLLVEHEPTITMGRGTKATSLPLSPETLRARGLTVAEIERGGDVTWHGPGQIVGYPILYLQDHKPDLHWYLRQLEEILIRALGTLGITAERNPGLTGVWTDGRKIASIGIHVRHWVTTHGFALNVLNNLSAFDVIIPCGIKDVTMTSVAKEFERQGRQPPSLDNVASALVVAMGDVFEMDPELDPDFTNTILSLSLPISPGIP